MFMIRSIYICYNDYIYSLATGITFNSSTEGFAPHGSHLGHKTLRHEAAVLALKQICHAICYLNRFSRDAWAQRL